MREMGGDRAQLLVDIGYNHIQKQKPAAEKGICFGCAIPTPP
jgi:hypothetical protein